MTSRIPQPQKVFCIGLNKTGTTTLARCAQILGYLPAGCDKKLLREFARHERTDGARRIAMQHDFFHDWPWPLIYREMDRAFPGSKFVLSIRGSEDHWLDSLKRHSLRTHPWRHCRKLAYGFNYPHRHEAHHLELYRRHNDEVRYYFRSRPSDLLVVCWEEGDGWDRLCGFLGKPVPASAFPHENRGEDQSPGHLRVLANRLLAAVAR
jgi:hypothetical protein